MSGSLNKWMGIGNLCRDPETRSMQDGSKVVNFTIACNETWRDKQSGERKERAEYVRIVVFNERIADVAEKYLKKGSKVYLEGQLQTGQMDPAGTVLGQRTTHAGVVGRKPGVPPGPVQ